MAGAAAGPELLLGGVETAGAAGIQHLLALGLEIAEELLLRTHPRVVEARREVAFAGGGCCVFERPVLGDPFHQPAVQHRDVAMAEGPERPPDTRCREPAISVIDHDPRSVADAELLHP